PTATTRERFRQHTDDPFCASCHQYIDDLGFGFEHFDAVGAWRAVENGAPIDARSDLNDLEGLGLGTSAPYGSLAELGALLAGSQAAPRCFVQQLWAFALGRAADGAADACHVDALADGFVASGGDVQALWVALVAHPAFVTRGPEDP
ncbi:MAG: DUF1588 domain-containing protein, partial [Myxococcales bacterium]|nr:DUF1588 domain-containing protein [Myxococcales bacterium]